MPLRPELLLEHDAFISALAKRLLSDANDGEDAAQESFISIWRNAHKTQHLTKSARRSWVATVVYNFARQIQRAGRRREYYEHSSREQLYVSSPAEVAQREESRRRVVTAVLSLEEPYRTVILLRYYEGLPARAIADHLNLPLETVKTRLRRGIELLRGKLDREFDGGRSAWALAVAPFLLERASPASVSIKLATGAFFTLKTTTQLAAGAAAVAIALLIFFRPWSGLNVNNNNPPPEPRSLAVAESRATQTRPAEELLASARRAAADTTELFIKGRVVDSDDRPIAGAKLVSYSYSRSDTFFDAKSGREGRDRKKEYYQEAVSDSFGQFTISVEEAAGPISIVANANGYSPGLAERVRIGDSPNIQLDKTRVFVGSVRDLDGNPIANANVRWLGLLGMSRIERAGTSADDGTVKIDGLPSYRALSKAGDPFLYWWVEAKALGFAPILIQHGPDTNKMFEPIVRYTSDEIRMDIVLVRGATLRGRVLDAETSEPLANTKVIFHTRGRSLTLNTARRIMSPYEERILNETTTNERGEYLFEHIPSKGFHPPSAMEIDTNRWRLGTVGAMAAGHGSGAENVDLPEDGGELNIDIRCFASGAVRGKIVNFDGKPAVGAVARIITKKRLFATNAIFGDASNLRALVDANGNYQFDRVPASRAEDWKLHIYALPPNAGFVMTDQDSVEVSPRPNETVEAPIITLGARSRANFIVKNSAGKPIGDALVTQPSQYEGGPAAQARTDRDGKATVVFAGSFNLKKPQKLLVRAEGYAPMETPEFTASASDPPLISVTLEAGHVVAGIVQYSDGTPIDRATVRIALSDATPEEIFPDADLTVPIEKRSSGKPILGSNTTDMDGKFHFEDLPNGNYHIAVTWWPHERAGNPSWQLYQFVRNVAADTTNIVVSLADASKKPPLTTILEGEVRDAESGNLVPNFKASLSLDVSPGAGCTWAMRTTPGRFRFDEAPAGDWALRVTADGYAPFVNHNIIISAGGKSAPLSVKLYRGTTIHGTVRAPSAEAAAGQPIEFISINTLERARTKIAANGTFEITGVGPGTYRARIGDYYSGAASFAERTPGILIITENKKEVRYDADVVAGGVIQCYAMASTSLRATPPLPPADGSPLVIIGIIDSKGNKVWESNTRWYQLNTQAILPPGNYEVIATSPAMTFTKKAITVEAGKVATATWVPKN